jgi:hypothetical protein
MGRSAKKTVYIYIYICVCVCSFTYKLSQSYPRINLTVHSVKSTLNVEHSLVNVGAPPRGSKSSSCDTECGAIQIGTVSSIGL